MSKILLIGGFLCLAAVPACAGIVDVNATGEGWCTIYCGNTDTSVISNTFAGETGGDFYRNWFAFDIPNIGPVSNATLWIWNDGENFTLDQTRTYTLYHPTAIDFDSLGSGSALGSVSVGVADTGVSHYVGIPLNDAALGALNAARGGQFVFGGAADIVDANQQVEMFGYTSGTPVAYLEYGSVPEPGTLSMLLVGLAVLGWRRRKTA